MVTNILAPIADQRTVLHILRSLEVPPDENVLETELVQKARYLSIGHLDECINELLAAGIVFRVKAPSGDFIRRTEE